MKSPATDKTVKELVSECNELARIFYKSYGYQVRKGYRFDKASHPQEAGMWNRAVMAYEFISKTNIEDALAELEDE
jgi:hypothetical protein